MNQAAAATSPCVKTCVIDPVTGFCIGCGRTAAEIARWTALGAPERAAVVATLAGRLGFMTSRAARRRDGRRPVPRG
jgi:predicted Fe-S protein YdhL (DUF1289 family)